METHLQLLYLLAWYFYYYKMSLFLSSNILCSNIYFIWLLTSLPQFSFDQYFYGITFSVLLLLVYQCSYVKMIGFCLFLFYFVLFCRQHIVRSYFASQCYDLYLFFGKLNLNLSYSCLYSTCLTCYLKTFLWFPFLYGINWVIFNDPISALLLP